MVFNRGNFANKRKINLSELAPYAIHLAMVIAVAVYVIVGAVAIRNIEATPRYFEEPTSPAPVAHRVRRQDYWMRRTPMNRTRRCVIAALHRLASQTNCSRDMIIEGYGIEYLDECYKNDLHQKAVLTQHEVRHRHEKEKQQHRERHGKSQRKGNHSQSYEADIEWEYWTLMDSVLFCFTVITTIGYGNVAPESFYGRIFVIFYGLVGVPFTMLAIANLGKFLASLLKAWTKPFIAFFRRCRRRCRSKRHTVKEKQRLMERTRKKKKDENANPADSDTEDEDYEEIDGEEDSATDALVLFFAFIIYVVIGSMVIATYEPEMDFFMAIYFNFVTLTTIGLGDLVPQSESYLVITLLYCAIGLALTTIAIEISADYLKKLHYFGRKLDNVGNVKIWFGGKQLTMKQLVRNLGDQFNVDVNELHNLNLDTFVDNAMRVEAGELSTLRSTPEHRPSRNHSIADSIKREKVSFILVSAQEKPYMRTAYWRAVQGNLIYVDEDANGAELYSPEMPEYNLPSLPSDDETVHQQQFADLITIDDSEENHPSELNL